ncbi:sugar phosphate isomerase/epimerase family protein [Runella sp.]|uniref:sugar phosphate isomerase/epimerase family protein n=1 Tax=Runella sp. TaxID=1960881 RepID=UPI003D0C656B
MNRREFIGTTLAGSAAFTLQAMPTIPTADTPKIFVFSKMFQWIEGYDQLAETIAGLGFNGIDLTVRPGGHVLPERVEEDLPKAVEAFKKHKLEIPMMVTATLEADALNERILKTAKSLGIKHYRMGWYPYDLKKSIPAQMEANAVKLKALAQLNEKYGMIGQYQNHSGNYLGAAIWDIQQILQKINSPYLGCQYDINHATYEASGSWQTGFELIAPHVKSIAIKDFVWEKKNNKWVKEGCPLGEGLVNWPKYLEMVKQHGLITPITMHYEYPLGGAENGAKKLTISSQELLSAMKKDLVIFKQWWAEAKL